MLKSTTKTKTSSVIAVSIGAVVLVGLAGLFVSIGLNGFFGFRSTRANFMQNRISSNRVQNIVPTSPKIQTISKSQQKCNSNMLLADLDGDGDVSAFDNQLVVSLSSGVKKLADYPCADTNNDLKFDATDTQTLINCATGNCGNWPKR